MKFPKIVAERAKCGPRPLPASTCDRLSAMRRDAMTIVPSNGVCYAIWSDGRCIVSGNNCYEGSPEAIESTYMGQTICGCRCV